MDVLSRKLLPNCDVSGNDVVNANKIYGPGVGSLKDKTVRHRQHKVKVPPSPIPTTLMKRYQHVVLADDIMFVNKIPFFITIARNIRFRTVEMITNQTGSTILKAIKNMMRVYGQCGFHHRDCSFGWSI